MSASGPILLVEDNPTDAELALRAIRKNLNAPRVEVVRDGEAAIDFVFAKGAFANRDVADLPAVVMLDLKLPKVNGLEVLRLLKSDERTRRMPVVVLTSSREDRDLEECYRRGANSYVVKPIDPDEFDAAVSQLATYWVNLNQPRA